MVLEPVTRRRVARSARTRANRRPKPPPRDGYSAPWTAGVARVWQTVDAPTSGRWVLCWGVAPQHSGRGRRGGAAVDWVSRPPACLRGSRVVAPPCRTRRLATAPTPVRSAGAFGGVRRTMVQAASNVSVGG